MFLSVSRRTDIPAFYSEWFMNRIRAGFYYVRNPMNCNQVSNVPITPDVVDCIIFWTKNPRPLLPYLDELNEKGYKYYFTYTLTGYGKDLEPNIASEAERIATFQELSRDIGKEKVIWRYDPIIYTEQYDLSYHVRKFEQLIDKLAPYTEKCVFSFVDMYRKIQQQMRDIKVMPLSDSIKDAMARSFSELAKHYGITLATCAEGIDLAKYGIVHNRCIDPDLIERIIGYKVKSEQGSDRKGTACGCAKCDEMGTFDTCLHGCKYCYANNGDLPKKNLQYYSEVSPFLIDDSYKYSGQKITMRKGVKSLKDGRIITTKNSTLF